ncbi:helix-turn-helix domain-containing protein [Alteromonas gracilis]|uniref:helix-turn-helix domain-containing protein n=1 Tax=Alteromonas gracilis TaxID=1479524 RepID=UPI0030CF9A68
MLITRYPYPVTRSDISDLLWGDTPLESSFLKTHIYNLRKALEPKLFTIGNVGYRSKELQQKKEVNISASKRIEIYASVSVRNKTKK